MIQTIKAMLGLKIRHDFSRQFNLTGHMSDQDLEEMRQALVWYCKHRHFLYPKDEEAELLMKPKLSNIWEWVYDAGYNAAMRTWKRRAYSVAHPILRVANTIGFCFWLTTLGITVYHFCFGR